MRKALLLSLAAAALLGEDGVTLGSINVNDAPITISSEGLETDRPTSLTKSASALEEVITRETIEALNPSDIVDVLQYASSVFIQRQGRKSPSFVKVRGNRSLGIIIDGIYMPSAVVSRILATLPVEAIERVRIIRDSAALNLGPLPNGTGGLLGGDDAGYLVIETRLPSKSAEALAAVQIENNGREHISAMGGSLSEHGYLNVLLDYDQSDGDPEWTTGFDKHSLYAKGGLFMGDWTLDLQSYLSRSELQLQRSTTPGVSDAKWSYAPMSIAEISARLSHTGANGTSTLSYAHSYLKADMQQYSWSNPDTYLQELQQENFDHMRFDHAMQFQKHTLRAGIEGLQWHTPTGEYFYTGWERKERTAGLFIQDEWHSGRLSLDAGLRVDKTNVDIGYEQIGAKRIRIEDKSLDPVAALALGIRWQQNDNLTFYGRSRLSTQNAPDVEIVEGGSLSSSSRYGFEAGIESSIGAWLRPRLSLYYLDVNDAPYVSAQRTNPDDATDIINLYDSQDWHEYGAELAFAGVYDAWSYQLSYSYNRNSDDTLDNRIPGSTFNGVISYKKSGFQSSMGLYYVDRFEAVNKAGTGEAGGYMNIDLSLGYTFTLMEHTHNAMLYARNLADDDYESVYGFPGLGRTVGVRYKVVF